MNSGGSGAEVRGRALARELLVFAGFAALTVVMTWPWAAWIRDAASDLDDPSNSAWILWWDWHQTFHDPLNLFQGNIFYPLKYTLAFSEHDYGIAILFFPLFWAGVKPFTMQGIATLVGFAGSGYGAFRLTRTLTLSTPAAWLAGIAFAFIPWRFGQMPHLTYVWGVWIPLLLEALVLFLRERTVKRATWLGVAFTMNALTCIHWFVLTLVPLLFTGIFLILRYSLEKDRALWRRGAVAIGVSGIVLLPFFVPYRMAASLYGFARDAREAAYYSAQPGDWLQMDGWNRLWTGFAEFPPPPERLLFPGLLILLLALAGILLSRTEGDPPPPVESRTAPNPRLLAALDALAVATFVIAVFAAGPKHIRVSLFGKEIFRASEPFRALVVCFAAVATRCCLAFPRFLSLRRARLVESFRAIRREDVVVVGAVWTVTGFLGSLGMNTPFHRTLFKISIFQSIRAPARWAIVAYLGLAVLAGVGALRLASKVRWPRTVFACLGLLLLFEYRAAPLHLAHGAVDPDEVTLYLEKTPMKGGLVVLPSGSARGNFNANLRAADHGKPLITATMGFFSPYVDTIEILCRMRPIPAADLLDDLEAIPTSYILVHETWPNPEEKPAYRALLAQGLASGRLRFIRRFDGAAANDLFAVVKNEPGAKEEEPVPFALR